MDLAEISDGAIENAYESCYGNEDLADDMLEYVMQVFEEVGIRFTRSIEKEVKRLILIHISEQEEWERKQEIERLERTRKKRKAKKAKV